MGGRLASYAGTAIDAAPRLAVRVLGADLAGKSDTSRGLQRPLSGGVPARAGSPRTGQGANRVSG